MTWWLSFGFVWLLTAVGVWALFHRAAVGDSTAAPPGPGIANRCGWCGGWADEESALLAETGDSLIGHGICKGCGSKMEEEGGLGAKTT